MGLSGVEARLDRLSAQMDLCIAEVMSWRQGESLEVALCFLV